MPSRLISALTLMSMTNGFGAKVNSKRPLICTAVPMRSSPSSTMCRPEWIVTSPKTKKCVPGSVARMFGCGPL